APASFSLAKNENILWTMDLPEGGQSGISVIGDKIFLSILKPVSKEDWQKDNRGSKNRKDIVGLCIDTKTQKILWQKEIKGSISGPSLYSFSDASTPTPLADEKHVWFYAASGAIACLKHNGKVVWEYNWQPIEKLDKVHFPFNKQFEPLMSGELIYNVEPYTKKDGKRTYGWNYIFAYHKLTGELKWISEDALTHYNTPFMTKSFTGKNAILIGRGGHHRVPEKPAGYSMIDAQSGKSLWQYKDREYSLYNSCFNDKYAIRISEKGYLNVLKASDGTLIKKISLNENVDALIYDSEQKKLFKHRALNFAKERKTVFPAWFSNILIGDQLYFMCFEAGHHKKNAALKHSFARVDLISGKVQYLQVPTSMNGQTKIYNESILSSTKNHRGFEIDGDKRSRRDGWHWLFNGNPIAVNGKIYFTLMNGRVYVIDAKAKNFDESALLSVSDLGEAGKTWSLTTPAFAGGKLYHRTLKQVICIGKKSRQ
ncbi:MAG: PQQ-binding-like beta-propeller repeat protein, partial [Lentisphaeraceae bacterium]|nr:PQQ-binding-like beta-propeller repeat protein [Lentisphaeraceae bacterium]